MAQRYGGQYSPEGNDQTDTAPRNNFSGQKPDPAGARSNVLFVPAIILVATTFSDGAIPMATGLIGAGCMLLGAWLLRSGLRAEAEFNARKVARRPALPRKIFAAAFAGIGAALAVIAHSDGLNILAPIIFGAAASALHLVAFGVDPLKSKGMEGIDTFQQDRVARVVDEAEKHLAAMNDAIRRAGDRSVEARVERFQDTVREMVRTVEDDPRDLTAARKYLGVYLRGARDASIKFADIFARSRDAGAKSDYMMLLTDLEENFTAKTKVLLSDSTDDLNIEIEVLRDRLARENLR